MTRRSSFLREHGSLLPESTNRSRAASSEIGATRVRLGVLGLTQRWSLNSRSPSRLSLDKRQRQLGTALLKRTPSAGNAK
jgi:hypothetical protein